MIKYILKSRDRFEFEAGGKLDGIEVAFHASAKEYDGRQKVIWICHALTANSDPEEWWPEIVGPGKVLDTGKYFIVCVNMIGSPYGTSGPSSIDPRTGRPFFFDFPAFTVRDMISASILVRKHLGIDVIDLLIGSSIGGFQAAEWAIMEPDVIKKLALMATDVRVSPWLSAWAESQRMALEADRSFRVAKDLEGGREGLKCARAQALISYRSFDGFCMTQAESDPDTLFAGRAASYERYQGEKLVKRFDAYSYWGLCNSLDSHNVGRNRGGVDAALSTIKAKTMVVSVDSDCLFPPKSIESWAGKIPHSEYRIITSSFGHDGFLLEWKQISEIIRSIL